MKITKKGVIIALIVVIVLMIGGAYIVKNMVLDSRAWIKEKPTCPADGEKVFAWKTTSKGKNGEGGKKVCARAVKLGKDKKGNDKCVWKKVKDESKCGPETKPDAGTGATADTPVVDDTPAQ